MATLLLRRRDNHLQVPPVKKTKAYPRIWFGKFQPRSVWGNIHASDEAPSKAKGTPTKQNKIDLTGDEDNTENERESREGRGTQDTLESTLDSKVSSLQSSL